MSYKPWSLLACAAAALIHTVAQPASALSCGAPGMYAPGYGASDVPTNTLVWCSRADQEGMFEVRVVDPQGLPVEGTSTLISSPQFRMTVFRPSAELEPHTEYRVSCREYGDPINFTTGAGPRQQTPAVPDLTQLSVRASYGDWGPQIGAELNGLSPEGTIVMLDLDGTAQLNARTLSGNVQHAEFMSSSLAYFFVGRAPCTHSWPQADLGATTRFRLAAFDLTGAFSGWSEWTELTIPDEYESVEETDGNVPWPVPVASEPPPDRVAPPAQGQPSPTETDTGQLISAELPTDNAAAPSSPRSSGCQLGTPSGTWPAAGLLAALACIAARRWRRSVRG